MDCANGAGAEGDRSKVNDFKEQILQLAGIACHEDEEKSRTELLEKLCKCNKYTLVELCRSFDIPGSTGTKKDELVTIVMEFLMEHCSGIDGTDPDKKVKKRKRKREGANLSGGKPSKKKKNDGSVLETHGEGEADGKKSEEDRTNYSEFDLKDNINGCTDNKRGQFPKEAAIPEPSERVNGSVLENLGAVSLTEVLIPTNEQTLATTPSAKLVSNIEDDNINMKASTKKNTSVTKKKATPKADHKEKSYGKKVSREDAKPRKQAVKPSKDELRQAVFVILDTANFATMTFGEVVKAVDKYFGKDLFDRKPLIRSLIEEELFRLAEEAEKKELEEEEAIEAKARAEQASKEIAKDGRVGSDTDNANELQGGQDGKCKDAGKSENSNTIEEGVKGGISVKAAENRNSAAAAAESSQDGKAEGHIKNEYNSAEFTKDGKAEKVVQNANDDDGVEISRYGKAKMAKQNNNSNNIGCSKDGRTEEASNGENKDNDHRTKECRDGNRGKHAEIVNDCQAEESKNRSGEHVECAENGEGVECAENGIGQEAGNNENSENTASLCSQSKAKEAMANVNTDQSLTEAVDGGKAEDAEHNGNTEVDVDSRKDGTAENGKTIDDAKTNSHGEA